MNHTLAEGIVKMKKKKSKGGMDRREVLRRFVASAGASAALPVLGHGGVKHDVSLHSMAVSRESALGSAQPADPTLIAAGWKPKFFDAHQNETVVALSDLIIPDTDTPGAKAALANRFIDLLLGAEAPQAQQQYVQALGWLDGHCFSQYERPFVQLSPAQQAEVLTLLTHENDNPEMAHGVKLFRIVKNSIVEAYYSSEIGMLQELKYETNPFQSEYPGCKNPDEHK
ncbi:MAG: hypothetical protein DMG06_27230 [Acidobacteria bacterium]|nr:MAG: hypothetical protein DMG06_27230 [Acidobacteriota bacterium]